MGSNSIFNAETWQRVPFHFWSVVFFTFGCMIGSFLNVCIHRMPLGESIVSPPSHCPHCKYSIPWYLNIPLVTWLFLRGKCANCGAPISVRYFMVELLTGMSFLACWLAYGHQSVGIAVVYCMVMAGLIASTFIDLEHFIIPDEITIFGMAAGFACSIFVPALHRTTDRGVAMGQSFLGIAVGAGVIYGIVRGGKLIFGRQKLQLEPSTKVVFTETAIVLPGQEIQYEELFYRKSDAVKLEAGMVELCDRCYRDVSVKLTQSQLQIGEDVLNPEEVPYMEATTGQLTLPREAMGLGDVKFMAAIGAFLGWQGVAFSIGVSSMIGSVVGLTLIALKKHERFGRMPYGPFITVAAVIWMFGGYKLWEMMWPR